MFTENLLFNIFGVLCATLIAIITYFKWKYTYWRNFGVEYPQPVIPFGNIKDNLFQKLSMGEVVNNFYHHLRRKNVIHGGMYFFSNPIYIPVDLDLIKRVMLTDFVHFTDHGSYVSEKSDPLTANLFALDGQRWRNLRVKLTPIFTSGKMKYMLPIMLKISDEFIKVLQQESDNGRPIEAKDISARLTTDIIGNCAFGLDCNSLADPNAEFRIFGKRLFDLTPMELMRQILVGMFPKLMKYLEVPVHPKVAADFFWSTIKTTVEYREKNNIRRNDFMQLLLDLKNNADKDNNTTLTFNELAAQAFVFYLGGFETSSTLMSFALMELASNQDVQNKLRDEIRTVTKKHDGKITYESLSEMKYLDMVVNETLRKYPPFPILFRKCTKDYRVPNTSVTLKEGFAALIPIMGIHYDPEYYPNPQKFDPLRFNDENRSKRHQFSFLPFGEGPRLCIGLRFGLMQAKIGLVSTIQKFKVKVNSQTKLPVKLDPKNFLLKAADALWLDLESIVE